MGMSGVGGDGSDGAVPNINVTPLIDVLLVLLIIFMIISPMKPHQFEAKVPSEPKDLPENVEIEPNPLTLVVAIETGTLGIKLNNESLGDTSDTQPLVDRLSQVFKQREDGNVVREGTNEIEKTVFIKAPKGVRYGDVVKVIDGVKQAGAQPVGLQIDDLSG
ncbi:MAG: biopolymer transporter ExbD [Acidobacteria bacterium]|nr:MAG: biopolymer transporter ExbD [Acidobacteriota bacterium]REK01917.1 MAG: biopolymer transporter ExbD [Acidobacteriota bacterium]REK14873.1 MAG: biopolymer transporter ExbD [Acidobacteriota bacterium]REK45588.1 MAG: biopolymer transporter ExbD [Acidobacteriota bacterium]